jgi:hypothetical protein
MHPVSLLKLDSRLRGNERGRSCPTFCHCERAGLDCFVRLRCARRPRNDGEGARNKVRTAVDGPSRLCLYSSCLLMRGASRGDPEVEQLGRRGGDSPPSGGPEPEGDLRSRGARGRVRTPPPGGSGGPAAPTTGSCLQWLHGVGMNEGESPPDAGPGRKAPVTPDTEDRVRGHKTPQVERRMASAFRRRAPPQGGTPYDKRRSALHPLAFEGRLSAKERQRDEGLPGADQRARAMTHVWTANSEP